MSTARPGCALLVDGVVVELGYYTQADRAKLETLFAADRCTLMITNQAKERNEALIQQAVARGSRRSDAEEHIKCLVEGRSICLVRFVHCPVKTAPSPISPADDGC